MYKITCVVIGLVMGTHLVQAQAGGAAALADARPWAGVAVVVFGSITAWTISRVNRLGRARQYQTAWRMGLVQVGWIPFAASFGLIGLLLIVSNRDAMLSIVEPGRIVETVVPLAMAVQAAFIFSPEDEPALEVMMACPRPLTWLVLERLATVFIVHAAIALLGSFALLLIDGAQDVFITLIRWIPPTIFLSGIAIYTTLRSRMAVFSVLVAGLVWLGLSLFAEALLPGAPMFWPFNLIQPYLWPFHPYLQPEFLPQSDYLLNRVVVMLAGINLLILALINLRDSERILLGTKSS